MELSKKYWRLFRERLTGWQEDYMTRLVKQYAELLDGDLPASSKFWQLEERINQDKKTPGVRLQLKKSTVTWNIAYFLDCDVITFADLAGFSTELVEAVRHTLKTWF